MIDKVAMVCDDRNIRCGVSLGEWCESIESSSNWGLI